MAVEDLRRYVRIEKQMLVRIVERHLSAAETREIKTVTKNLAEGGIFVEMDNPPAKGTIVEVEFTPPHGQRSIRTLGIVRWSTTGKPSSGAGIKFAPVSERDRSRLLTLVRQVKRAKPKKS